MDTLEQQYDIEVMSNAYNLLESLPDELRTLEYKKILETIHNYIHYNCKHNYITDVIDIDVEQCFKAVLFNFWLHIAFPEIRVHQVCETLIGTTQVWHVDQINCRRERREIGQGVLRGLDRATLNRLNKCHKLMYPSFFDRKY